MSQQRPWAVYGGPPPAVYVRGKRAARKLARRYARLGMHADLYEEDDDGQMVRRGRYLPDGTWTTLLPWSGDGS
ncbi:MAG TPA: hypothetical protein VK586_03555 [Streptosporangiaceae bacterium]|nr:hypothetical protein [Streptosporangiaceae bacterium]